jgi:predicted TIM-barrel fold metal-dependent hydrolase
MDGWYIDTPGEPECAFDPADHDPARRAELVRADGLDLACVALSSPLGIEALPPSEGRPLLDAWHEGAAAFPPELRAWAAPCLRAPDLAEVGALLDSGFVGLCLPAEALSEPAGVERVGPMLDLLGERDAPLFVHPGPARLDPHDHPAAPSWWPALTRYVAAMNAAWHAFASAGPVHPGLRVCFAMLAGLAPLQRERLLNRGGAPAMPEVFLDTSSYGPRAIDAVIRELGVDSLVHGSDRPVIAPAPPDFGEAVRVAMQTRNPARLLALAEVPA